MLSFKKKVNQEQFNEINKRFDGIDNKIESLEKESKLTRWVVGIGITASLAVSGLMYQTTTKQIDAVNTKIDSYRNETKIQIDVVHIKIDAYKAETKSYIMQHDKELKFLKNYLKNKN